jgi:DNA-binding MarR family transcriptional regulator
MMIPARPVTVGGACASAVATDDAAVVSVEVTPPTLHAPTSNAQTNNAFAFGLGLCYKPGMGQTSEPELVDRWRRLLSQHATVSCALERALEEGHGIGVSEFETLDWLVGARGGRRRMSELAADMYLSQSALSRTVARLEDAGLVARAMCSDDRRAVFVGLTDAGRTLHRRARRTRYAVLSEHLN